MVQRFASELIEAEAECFQSIVNNTIEVQLRGFLYSEATPAKKTIKHPSDWWQSLKERWFPLWALKRWPVKYTVHDISFKVLYPDFRPQLAGQKWCAVTNRFN